LQIYNDVGFCSVVTEFFSGLFAVSRRYYSVLAGVLGGRGHYRGIQGPRQTTNANDGEWGRVGKRDFEKRDWAKGVARRYVVEV
jgi:hypothetical protein